ncbi:protein mahjong [Ceratitis capitata]|uniref:(Mediterranean fruit fly) hypothetical protein n=1 Tax=Ceratitis capitata TaxID=7213 RepID=W8B9F5_CERCA|nr:protein mahjong [Ceratitis capitata]CAD7012783.1 unnamed protein product [Ceratitis capitata]
MPPYNVEPVGPQQSDADMHDDEDNQATGSTAELPTFHSESTSENDLVNGNIELNNADMQQAQPDTSGSTDIEMNISEEAGSVYEQQPHSGTNGLAEMNTSGEPSSVDEHQSSLERNAEPDAEMNDAEESRSSAAENANDDAEEDGDGENEEAEAGAAGEADPFYGFEDEDPSLDKKDMSQVLQIWEAQQQRAGFDPVPILKRLCEIFEKEKEIYMRKDHDPFEDRHPYRIDPKCHYGVILKQLFRKDVFMTKLLGEYMRDNFFTRQSIQKSSLELNILACRLMLVIAPGLETAAVFQGEFENVLHRIFNWAEDSIEPLQSYATGLLASAMEVPDIVTSYKEHNCRLIPKLIKRLTIFQEISTLKSQPSPQPNRFDCWTTDFAFGLFSDQRSEMQRKIDRVMFPFPHEEEKQSEALITLPLKEETAKATPSFETSPIGEYATNFMSTSFKDEQLKPSTSQNSKNGLDTNCSNSNLSALLENSRDAFPKGRDSRYYKKLYIPYYPPTTESAQMLILRYLTALGSHQDYLSFVFEQRVMDLIFRYLENLDRQDTCLAFEALKYLASILSHKKITIDFISKGGLEILLKVPRPSIAATGVSIALYYLAYCEEAMERVSSMPKAVIKDLVNYVLWLLERSYDSAVCHATMFFGLTFQYKVILDEFDAQDGIRKLYNVVSILKILNPSNNDDEDEEVLNDDLECASRQLVRHVCVALKRYMESHLYFKYNNFMRQQCSLSSEFSQHVATKAAKASLEQVSEQVRILQENTSVRAHWMPVNKLMEVSAITLLLKIVALSYDWNNNVRSEIVRSALDVLSVCCVIPRIFQVYCDRLEVPDSAGASGIYFILAAASGDITADADVQKSALAVLVHCVCAPLTRESNNVMKVFGSSRRNKMNNRYCEELVEKVWESVCSNNGIIILLSLMQIKAPITDADCIRGMACRALAGLARSERVRQIVGKLALFSNGQIQTLMRDPILQEKRAEHVLFQKYAMELLERVSGKTKPISNQMDSSLANIHKANVVAQTKIQYNEQQLYQLIHDHLESKGLMQTAQMLQKEAGLPQMSANTTKNFHQSPFDYKVLPSSSVRQRLRSRMQDVNNAIQNLANTTTTDLNSSLSFDELPSSSSTSAITPIKLVKKSEKISTSGNALAIGSANAQRSLQKQISSLPEDVRSERDSPAPQLNNQTGITLGTIVTEYLTNQHALCNNPMTTCPQFDLFTPHKCPDPKPNRVGDNLNLTARVFRAQAGFNTARLDRRYVHSNFAPWRSVRSSDFTSLQFATCEIVSPSKILLVGTNRGEVKAFNLNSGTEVFTANCHSYVVDAINANRAGDLVLTSCTWRAPLSVLWSITENQFVTKMSFADDYYCEFNNLTQDKVLGTRNECAVTYDINTGKEICTFVPTLGNQYVKNRATFGPTDELILSDGVLWDVRSGKEIHKFDKLNQSLSGVFHPNGLEIISNTEVWDLRTFHLLQTVPVLDQCFLKFSPMRVIYSYNAEAPDERADNIMDDLPTTDTSFKVLDAYDYSSISTIDVRRGIYDMSINDNGSLLALVENQPAYDTRPETFVKIYAVGMKKIENQDEEDDDDIESSIPSDSDSSELFDLTEGLAEARRDNRRRRANLRANGGIEDVESGDGSDDSDDEDGDSEDGWIDVNSTNDEDDDNEQAQADSSSSDDEIMEIRFEPF